MVYVGEAKALLVAAKCLGFILSRYMLVTTGFREAKALPVPAKSPLFISVEVDAHYNKGIRKAKAPPVAIKSLCSVSLKVGARYDRGIFDQHGLSGGFLF